jgi:hypothetical protein
MLSFIDIVEIFFSKTRVAFYDFYSVLAGQVTNYNLINKQQLSLIHKVKKPHC